MFSSMVGVNHTVVFFFFVVVLEGKKEENKSFFYLVRQKGWETCERTREVFPVA